MKYRFSTVLVCLLYLSVALVIGQVHHHEHEKCPDGDHDDCAACQWQLNAVTDVPNIVPLIFGCLLETPVQVFDFTSYTAPSFSFSPSRAPPAASA
jgi:hypothetical protein